MNASVVAQQQVIAYLRQKGVSSLPRLQVHVDDGVVTLSGTVNSFYERQLCISCKHLTGIKKVVDELKVPLPSHTHNAGPHLRSDSRDPGSAP